MSLKAWAIKGVTIIVILALWSSFASFEPTPPGRDHYRPYDLENEPGLQWFRSDYAAALETQATWLHDPTAVGLRVAGYPNVDGVEPEEVSIFHHSPISVTIIVTNLNAIDDSISASENRVELVKQRDIWVIAWAGRRWQCGRDFLRFGWTTFNCS